MTRESISGWRGLLVLVAFAGSPCFGTEINAVSHNALPEGETMTFTGNGFTGPTKAMFFYDRYLAEATDLVAPADDTLQFAFPDLNSNTGDFFVVVEAAAGSTATTPDFTVEFTGNGPVPALGTALIVRSGAVATSLPNSGFDRFEYVYVESGGVLQGIPSDMRRGHILGEDGATLDFRGSDFSGNSRPPTVYYSAGTTILGDLPVHEGISDGEVREITPLLLSEGIGSFGQAAAVNVNIVGDGNVSIDTGSFFVRWLDFFTLTATPGDGSVFSSWSGASGSSDPVLTLRVLSSEINLTANFAAGFKLETFSGSGGSIAADPDLPCFDPGQSASLTAVPNPGYEFVRWGGDLAGVTEATTPLTFDGHKTVSAVFRKLDPGVPTLITSASDYGLPVGETLTLAGSGFTNPSQLTFLYDRYSTVVTDLNAPSDGTLTLAFPELGTGGGGRYFVLVETAGGSTVTVLAGLDPVEFEGFGPIVDDLAALVVREGAIVTSLPTTSFDEIEWVYVESGGVLQGVPANMRDCHIFAEDGATLDFRGTDFSQTTLPPSVYYSAGTTVLGDLPVPGSRGEVREIAPLALSRNIDSFGRGITVHVSVEGDGSVNIDRNSYFVRWGDEFTLTAMPGDGSIFTAWSGASASTDPVLTLRAFNSDFNLTAHFAVGFKLEKFAGSGGSIRADPDLECYADGAAVSVTATPAKGYEFIKWGGDLAGVTEATAPLAMDAGKTVSAVFRKLVPDAPTLITSVDRRALAPGETMTFTGSGLTGPSRVTFLDDRRRAEATDLISPSDDTLSLTFPELWSSVSDHFALVEAAGGSTATVFDGLDPVEFGGFGPVTYQSPALVVKEGAIGTMLPDDSFRMIEWIYVESGAVLQGVPSDMRDGHIFAEDGATLDFRGSDFSLSSSPPSVYYSAGTTVLGNLPVPGFRGEVREVTPLSLSRGIGPFSEGCALTVIVEGQGSVTVDPDQTSYGFGDRVDVTAVPDPGWFFIRWVGPISTSNATDTVRVAGNCTLTARFSDRPDFFSSWRTRYFTAEELADPNISGLAQDPDRDFFTNAAEYAFGTNPTVAEAGNPLRIRRLPPDQGSVVELEYFRPANAADISYEVRAALAPGDWKDGTTKDLLFSHVEQETIPQGNDIEKVTVAVTFLGDIPRAAFFQITADIETIP